MITIFNRKELFATFSVKEQADVRDALAAAGIDYNVKVVNRMSPSPVAAGSRAQAGTFGQKQDLMYEYTIYVRRKDWDQARHLIGK
jgi:hypothetical protein